ncbi:acyl-CoA dehydrogenase family protein [uncultured Pseudoramibacter sp.]|uniref:acyl-CoA dehydrogenase family protein n=1 Tax=uncultured Pseudoramibacter sp. TaxID=1623493 RepID=UPI0025DC6A7B|nr:acyl-CoA dehydrogenase family protein [uncultured Pseudoramibacter sp.]
MDFSLTEQQKAIQQKARAFAQRELAPGAQERDMTEVFPMDILKKLGNEGLIGLQFPKAYGGQGLDYLSFILVVEELCKVDSAFGIAYAISSTFTTGINLFGSEAQKQHVMPRMFEGDALGCFALTEPDAGSDAGAAKTTAVLDGDTYVVNGKKRYITNSAVADYCMLIANTDLSRGSKGLSAFLVDLKETPGVSIGHIENKCGIRSAKVAEIIFEDARIPKDRMIGEEFNGFRYALTALNAGRLSVAAQGLGLAQGAFDICRDYMKERKQFGRPLYTNQYLAFKMADLQSEIEMARLLLYKGVWLQQNGADFSVAASKAKLICTNLAMKVTTECIQNMGGAGYMREQNIERMFRDAKITQIYEGTNEIQRLIISKPMFK